MTETAIKKNVWQMPESSPYLQGSSVLDNNHLLVQVLKRSGILVKRSPQGAWDHIADEMLLEFAESGHPISVQRLHFPGRVLKSKGHGKLSIHFTADHPTIETIFRIIISANQLILYGAVAAVCEEFEAHQDRSGELDVLMGQSIVPSELRQNFLCRMKTLHIIKYYGNSTKNESNHFHKKAKRANFVRMQNFFMLLKWDSIS